MKWIPGVLFVLLQAYLEPGWTWMHVMRAWLACYSDRGCGSCSVVLALALSAWVKWEAAAGALMFGASSSRPDSAVAVNGVHATKWGHLFNISALLGSVWVHLSARPKINNGGVSFRMPMDEGAAVWSCWSRRGAVMMCL